MLNSNNLIQKSTLLAGSLIKELTSDINFENKLKLSFGNDIQTDILKETWKLGQFDFPEVEIVSSADINNANGAYAKATNKIYLAQEFLYVNRNNTSAIVSVILEEYGHYLDSKLNTTDTPGDEGAIFAAVVQGEELSNSELQHLKQEDDTAVVVLDGESVAIEKNDRFGDTIDNAFNLEFSLANDNDSESLNLLGNVGDNTNISLESDVDFFKFRLEAGEYVLIDIDTNQENSSLDSVLRLFDADGNELAFSDDDADIGEIYSTDSSLLYEASQTDTYYLGVSSYNNTEYDPQIEGSGIGNSTGEYSLGLEKIDPVFISSHANWTDTTDALYVNGLYTNEVRWGERYSDEQSGLRFDGVSINRFSLDEPFEIGTLTHFNNPTTLGTAASEAELEITLDFPNLGGSIPLLLSFDVDETTNTYPCPYPSSTACSDLITFPYNPNTKNQRFYHDGELYTFQIIGFGEDFNNLESGLISEEYNSNSTKLFGLLTKGEGERQTISTNQTIDGSLSTTDYYDSSRRGRYIDDYILYGGTDGQEVQIKLESPPENEQENPDFNKFNTYLQIIDAKTGEVIESDNDSGDGQNSFINLKLNPEQNYIVRVSSYSEDTRGDYTLTTTSLHKVLERFAKKIAYEEYGQDDIGIDVGYFYKIDRVFKNENGLNAVGLVSTQPNNPPILAFRGTELGFSSASVLDLYSDAHAKGIGFNQLYDVSEGDNYKNITDWLKQKNDDSGLKPHITGHSLGGALAQWVAADHSHQGGQIGEVVTFNSPGISYQQIDDSENFHGHRYFNERFVDEVTHYITSSDLVSMAGESYIDGEYKLYDYDTGLPNTLAFEPHLAPIFHDKFFEDKPENDKKDRPVYDLSDPPLYSTDALSNPKFSFMTDDGDYVAMQALIANIANTIEFAGELQTSAGEFLDNLGQVVRYIPSLNSYVMGSAISGYGSIQSNIGEKISDLGEAGNFIASAMQYRETVEPARKEIGEFIELVQNRAEDFVDNSINTIQYWTPKAIQIFSIIAGRATRFFYFNDISTNLDSGTNLEDLSAPLENAIQTTQNYLAALIDDSNIIDKFDQAFGNDWNIEVASLLVQSWSEGNFANIPEIKIVSSAEIAGNSGAYELSSGDIYLAKEFIAENANDTDLIASVILEEIGHHVDSLINTVNAPGDEGEIFSALVRGEELSEQRLQELQTEDDLGTVIENTVLWDTVGEWSEEAWNASAEWSDEAWDAIANWSETDWQETTEWVDEQWQETTEWTEEEWIETIDELFPLQVADWRQTATGYVIQFNEQIELDSLKLSTQQPNIFLTNQIDETINGYYIWDEETYSLTFVKAGGLLESDIYNLKIVSGEIGLLSELGMQLDGNGDRNEGDDYTKIFANTVNTNDLVLGLPDLISAPGETIQIDLSLQNNSFEGVSKVEFDLYYNSNLLNVSGISLADNLPTNWQITESQIDDDNGVVSVSVEGTDLLNDANLDLISLEAVVPNNAQNGELQILNLENVSVNGGVLNVLDDDAIQKVEGLSIEERLLLTQVHRFYQYEKGFHLYTADTNEIDYVKQKSESRELAYSYEAEKYQVLSDDVDVLTGEEIEGVEPIYRFFNTGTGAHLYTMNEDEKDYVIDNLSNYNFEGIKYYAFEIEPENVETIPVYRMLNTQSGAHLFSSDLNEIGYIEENLPHFAMENEGNAVFHVLEL